MSAHSCTIFNLFCLPWRQQVIMLMPYIILTLAGCVCIRLHIYIYPLSERASCTWCLFLADAIKTIGCPLLYVRCLHIELMSKYLTEVIVQDTLQTNKACKSTPIFLDSLTVSDPVANENIKYHQSPFLGHAVVALQTAFFSGEVLGWFQLVQYYFKWISGDRCLFEPQTCNS